MAPRRRIDRARDFPFENDFLPLQNRVGHRDGGEESLRVRMPGVLVENLGRGHLDDPPQVHHPHVITDVGHHIQVVGDEQVG